MRFASVSACPLFLIKYPLSVALPLETLIELAIDVERKKMEIILESYRATWTMCLGLLVFAIVTAALVTRVSVPKLDWVMKAKPVFAASLLLWFLFLSLMLTLIDEPSIPLPEWISMSMVFMLSAFLGIPLSVPMLAVAVWSMHAAACKQPIRLGALVTLALGTFMLGCAASNVHDLLWCGCYTEGFTQHRPAGSDIQAFIDLGSLFGISTEITADYATLGACAVVLIITELIIACASLRRFMRLYSNDEA